MQSLLTRAYGTAPLVLCLTTLGWAGNTIASRLAVDEVSPMMLIFLRWLLVAAMLAAIYGRDMRRVWPVMKPRLVWVAVMGGAGLSLFNALFYIAAHYTTAVNLGIIQSIMPGLILLGSFVFFGTRIRWLQGLGLLLTFVGVAVVVTRGALGELLAMRFNYGDLLILSACFFYAGFALGLRNKPEVNSLVLMGYFSIAALVTTIPLLALEHVFWGSVPPSAEGWMIILFVAVWPSFLSQVFFIRGVELIGPGRAGLYANTVPIFSAFLAVVLLGEAMHLHHVAALAIVFTGIYLFERLRY